MNIYLVKMKRSALITLGGMIVTIVPVLANEMMDFISTGDRLDYRTAIILAIGASSTWLVNSAKQLMDYLTSLEETTL